MKDYSTISNTSGTFPNVVSQNISTPGAGDGTPFIKQLIDDLWGYSQALMSHANLTPDGVTESGTASQRLTAIQRICGHPGEVIAWMGNTADPSSVDIRLLPLNGQVITIASYQDLVDATYVGDGNNPTASAFYKTSDAGGTTRSISGTYFVLPDCRGYVLRGLDTAASVDPDGASRDIGNVQDWAIRKHEHYMYEPSAGRYLNSNTYNISLGAGATIFDLQVGAENLTDGIARSILSSGGTNNVPAGNQNATENRMVNIACRWVIRY